MNKTVTCRFCAIRIQCGVISTPYVRHLMITHGKDSVLASRIAFEDKHPEVVLRLADIAKDYVSGLAICDLAGKYVLSTHEARLAVKYSGCHIRGGRESHRASIYRDKIKKSIMQKYGVDNASKSQRIKDKKKSTFLAHFGYENNFCNETIHKKAIAGASVAQGDDVLKARRRIALIAKYGVENVAQIAAVADRISKASRQRMDTLTTEEKFRVTQKARAERMSHGCISNFELAVSDVLNDLGVMYEKNKFLGGRFYVDFVVKNVLRKDFVIEANGDFWHGNPRKYLPSDILFFPRGRVSKPILAEQIWQKDKKRTDTIVSLGYDVLILWESDCRTGKRYDSCKIAQIILEYIKKQIGAK